MSSDILERLREPSEVTADWRHVALHHDAAEEILCLRLRVMELTDALIDARHNGLIYWRPMTERGVVEQATMMSRIDKVLNKEAKP